MTPQEEQALHTFETRVRQLILGYKQLEAENRKLKQLLADKQQALEDTAMQAAQLQSDYEHLKTARILSVSNDDMQGAKARITRLIREVDKCIALLNV